MMETTFLYVIPSALTVLAIVNIIILAVMPKSAKLLLLKKLGFMKGKTLNLIADNDYYMSIEAMEVAPEGLLEKKRKKKSSLFFYLAKPNEETPNQEENAILKKVEVDRLPPYNIDGIPCFISHIAEAYATNPRVVVSLQYADKVDQSKPKELKAEMALNDYFRDIDGKIVQTMPIKVLLPWDPVALAKVGLKVPQTRINQTQRRYEDRGAIKNRKEPGDLIKLLIVFGAVVCVGMIITALATGLLG